MTCGRMVQFVARSRWVGSSSVAEPASKVVKKLGGFELINKIGQGGMGTVFRARQISLDRHVALKILPSKIAQRDPVFIERFIREARTSAKLNHPNIVQGIEVGKDDATGLYYFAMEFIDGATIKTMLKNEKVIAEKRTLEIVMGVTQALICAHRAGIVHRDIKPDNILLTSRGEPKLADLGLARHALDSDLDDTGGKDEIFGVSLGHAELTQAGAAIGTPSYMAPEQVKAEMDKIDARTDLYALGATMFHMLTGKAPFVAADSRAVMMMHLNAPVPDARTVNPALSEAVSKLVSKLMQKEQNKRLPSAEELAKEIDRILNGAPVERLRRGSGKQLAIRDTDKQRAIDPTKPPTGDQSAHRTHTSGSTANSVIKGTRPHAPVMNKKLLYGGLAVAGVAICGIVIAFTSGGTPSVKITNVEKPAAQPGTQPETGTQVAQPKLDGPNPTNSTTQAPTKVNAEAEKWEPFNKAMKAVREKPEEYAAGIKLLEDSEKGAPPSLVPDIRHEKMVLERDRDLAFRKALDEQIKKARETVGGGKADFIGALALVKDGALPESLMCDANRAELAKVRGEFETQTTTAFNGVVGGSIKYDLEHEKEIGLQKLQTMQQKLDAAEKVYPVKAVQTQIAEMRKSISERIKTVSASLSQSQESAFCRSIDAAWASSRAGDYTEAVKSLMKIHSDQTIAERYGSKAEILKHDLETVRDLIQKSSEALDAKMSSKEDVLLHPVGGSVLGKISGKDKDGTFTFETRDVGEQVIDPTKMDPGDLLMLSGNKADGQERKYLLGVCSFWQGKGQKACDYFGQLKKESSEGSDAGIYLAFMNTRATELMTKIQELYTAVQSNSGLSAEDKKSKQADAQALLARLKTDFGATEAYSARKQKK